MTISQVIQTISLGNFTYFTVPHAYFSQISSTTATMPPCFGNNVMFCRGRIGMGRIGQELHWQGSDWQGSHRLGLHCPGPFCTAKTFYTEQRVVIQECINLYYREPEEYTRHGLAYRDPITEGYCPTPNFFIRGKYFAENDNPFSTTELHINRLDFNKKRDMQFQFPDRLFDRDTLILMTFEVNFMYILHAFATGNDVSNAKAALRSHFRKGFIETLESLYEIKPLENVTAKFVTQNFHEFNGKVFYDNANKRFLSASPRLPISSGRGHGDFCN